MPLIFPSNPTLNQLYQSGSSATYTWNGSFWQISAPAQTGLSVLTASYSERVAWVQETPPPTSTGSLWYDVDTGNTYVRYDSAWVPVQSNTVNATSASFARSASLAATASFVAKRWITLGRSSNLTGYGLNSEIVWNTVVSSSNANITVSSQNITLPAGTYQVMGTIGTNDYSSADGYINVALQNSSNVTLPGVNVPNPGPMTAGYNFGVISTMLGIIQLTTQTVVKLRLTAAAGTCTVNTDTRLSIIEI